MISKFITYVAPYDHETQPEKLLLKPLFYNFKGKVSQMISLFGLSSSFAAWGRDSTAHSITGTTYSFISSFLLNHRAWVEKRPFPHWSWSETEEAETVACR